QGPRPVGACSGAIAHPAQAEQQYSDRKPTVIHTEEVIPADQEAPEVAQPGEAALHRIPQTIVVLARDHWTPRLGLPVRWASLGRDAHADATVPEACAKRATIIPAIRHELRGSPSRSSARASDHDGI